jgi:cell division protease FtsH
MPPLLIKQIVPTKCLGAAWYLPEERLIVRPDQMMKCETTMRVVNQTRISTGALSDLEK